MKKFFLILYGLVMVITAIASVYLYTHQKPEPLPVSQDTGGNQQTGPLYVPLPNGEPGPLLEPAKDAQSVDPTTGNVILSETPNYITEYFPDGQTFNITLTGKNLRESRIAAEQDLLQRFQITPEQACSLTVWVGTIMSVSQGFSGQPLGLSFCPNRVDLPTEATDPAEPGSSTGPQPDVAL